MSVKTPIYLDCNATAPLRPQAIAKMAELLALPSNPSSVHSFGRLAKKHLEDARKTIAESIVVWANEVVFTASGTEANATALLSFPERRILVSAIEHSSVLKLAEKLGGEFIKIDENGVVSLSDLEQKLAENPKLAVVSIMLANNETGVVQPISEAAQICKKYGAILHCDAVQALGKIPVDFSLLGLDMLTISAHKCGGAVGAAALVVKNNRPIKPLLIGGGQELGRRAGTENIASIVAFAEAVQNFDFAQMRKLRIFLSVMENEIETAGGIIIGKNSPRLPNTSNIIMPKVDNQVQLMNFDLGGFAVSAGSACSSGKVEISGVLLAMGLPKDVASCAIRVSGGWNSSEEEIKKFTSAWLGLKARLT